MMRYREVEVETPSDREIVLRRSFNAPPNLVFDAFTKPELLRRWMFGPDGWHFTTCTIDLRVGGQYRYEWHQDSGSGELAMTGTFQEIEPARRLVSSELFDGGVMGDATLVTVDFAAVDGGTLITHTLIHANKAHRDMALQSGMDQGMEAGFKRLEDILAEMAPGR